MSKIVNLFDNVPEGTVIMVPANQLHYDPEYQTDGRFKPWRASAIAKNWDWDLYDPIKICRNPVDGRIMNVNGRHRTTGAQEKFGEAVLLPAYYLGEKTPEEAARIFGMQDELRQSLTPVQRFIALAKSGDEESLAIMEVLRANGWKVGDSHKLKSTGNIQCIGVIWNIWRCKGGFEKAGPDVLAEAIRILVALDGNSEEAGNNQNIGGMAKFLMMFGCQEGFSADHLIECLEGYDLKTLRTKDALHIASQMGGVSSSYHHLPVAYAIWNRYNKGLRGRRRLRPQPYNENYRRVA